MTRNRRLAVVLLAVLASACSKHSSSASCTPPPANQLSFTLDGTQATAAAGHMADLRFTSSLGTLYCTSSLIPASGSFQFSGSAFGPIGNFDLELIINSGANPTFGPASHHYSFGQGTAGTISGGQDCAVDYSWSVPFDFATAAQSPVTWAPGAACPGGGNVL